MAPPKRSNTQKIQWPLKPPDISAGPNALEGLMQTIPTAFLNNMYTKYFF